MFLNHILIIGTAIKYKNRLVNIVASSLKIAVQCQTLLSIFYHHYWITNYKIKVN